MKIRSLYISTTMMHQWLQSAVYTTTEF